MLRKFASNCFSNSPFLADSLIVFEETNWFQWRMFCFSYIYCKYRAIKWPKTPQAKIEGFFPCEVLVSVFQTQINQSPMKPLYVSQLNLREWQLDWHSDGAESFVYGRLFEYSTNAQGKRRERSVLSHIIDTWFQTFSV